MSGPRRKEHVLVFGGGIGGLSVAHELSERGFRVTIYERNPILGGKARSVYVPGSATGGRKGLPGEHGFRFFPGFYKHIDDLLKRIPYPGNPRGVFDNLISADHWYVAGSSSPPLIAPAQAFASLRHTWDLFQVAASALRGRALNVPARDLLWFAWQNLVLLTSSQERRFGQYEYVPWLEFFKGERHAAEFERYVLSILPLIFVACRAEEMSARTGATAFLRLCRAALVPGRSSDRVLNGPTNEVWIDPWADHLRRRGVAFHLETQLLRFECDGRRIAGAVLLEGAREVRVTADHYVAAVPAEVMSTVLTPDLVRAAPALERIRKLRTEWLVGLQFYLDRDVPIVRGHGLLLDSPWMITTISQRQFWRGALDQYGDGTIQGILSVIVSEWNKAGIVFGKPAKACSPAELQAEIWAQIKMHLHGETLRNFEQARVVAAFVDPSLSELPGEGRQMREPYLLNTLGSWDDRPEAVTALPNLFLAADYVRTYTDLATMEGANEAARRAVNGVLDAARADGPRCPVWPLREPVLLAPLGWLDARRYRRGLPHLLDLRRRERAIDPRAAIRD